MLIDTSHLTPISAFIGGLIIGTSAVLFILLNGRIAGISGIVGGLLKPIKHDVLWRVVFIVGMLMAPLGYSLFAPLPNIQVDANYPLLVLAGLLVGFGTRYGSGCTSGHGICGISRLSPRSIIATCSFMASGIITVFLMRHVLGSF
ncbi:MAG: YeeE/YedE family protein [Candidatus Saccharibacteria bacterium]|nr:YeeE/YedE family protein [Moraxellaceae bacterium]